MKLVTRAEASREDYAPTKPALSKQSKKKPLPNYFVEQDGDLFIDIDHPDWLDLIQKRKDQDTRGVRSGMRKKPEQIARPTKEKKIPKPKKNQVIKSNREDPPEADYDEELDRLIKESTRAKIMEPILKNQKLEYSNERDRLQLEKEAGIVIEYNLAEFLFFGYMERINRELLTLPDKIEAIIDTHVKEQNTRGITKEYKHQMEEILITIKKAQAEDVKRWREEN